MSPGTQTIWHSNINTGTPEWAKYDMGSPVLFTNMFCTFANGREGVSPRIEVSNDDQNWVTIHSFNPVNYSPITPENYRNYQATFNVSSTYRYVRLYSEPSPYCNYAYFQFFGLY